MKKSTLIFIFANLVVMSVPFWATLPLNKQIAAGKIRDSEQERENALYKKRLGNFSNLRVKGTGSKIELTVYLGEQNLVVVDTIYRNYIRIDTTGGLLTIELLESYKKRKRTQAEEEEVVAVVADDNSYENSLPSVSVQLYLKNIKQLWSNNVSASIQTDLNDSLDHPIVARLDSSSLRINCYVADLRSSEDGSNENDTVKTLALKHPLKVLLRDNSSFDITGYDRIDLDLTLENSQYEVGPSSWAYFKNLSLTYDDASDVSLKLSDLKWIKLKKKH